MSLGRGDRERGAGVSRSECEQCGLVRGWGPGEQGISRLRTACLSLRSARVAAGPFCLPAAKVTPDTHSHGHQQISATSASFWKTASTLAMGEAGLRRKI